MLFDGETKVYRVLMNVERLPYGCVTDVFLWLIFIKREIINRIMDTDSAKKLLISLLSERNKRTKISQIREIFDEIETALSSGVSRTVVVEKLNEAGINISFNTFKSALQVIRKEKQRSSKKNIASCQEKNVGTPEIKTDENKKDISHEHKSEKHFSISDIKSQPVDLATLTREFKNLPKKDSHGNKKNDG